MGLFLFFVARMSSFFRFALLGFCLSLLCQWSADGLKEGEETQANKTSCNLAVKHLLLGHLRKTRLWRRVVGETRHSRGKGRPAWFLLGILLLSGDVELNPGPKTGAADKKGIILHILCFDKEYNSLCSTQNR